MNIYIIGGGTLLLAVLVLAIALFIHERRRVARESAKKAEIKAAKAAQVNAWIEQIEAAQTDEQVVEAGGLPHAIRPFTTSDRLAAALDKYAKAYGRILHLRTVEEYREHYAADVSPSVKAKLLQNMHSIQVLTEVTGIESEQLGDKITELLLEELAAARRGDDKALLRFLSFKREQKCGGYGSVLDRYLNENHRAALAFPDDWNDLLVATLKNPSIRDFRGISLQPPSGAVRLMAAQALEERSLTLGQIVLAFCSVRDHCGGQSCQAIWPYRQEIGDVLLTEVTKMVHAIHVEQHMFVDA